MITDTDLWLHLKSGWQIEQQGVPTRDSFAFTTEGQKWINSNWLYDWGLYQLEVMESRSQARKLLNDYRALLTRAQEPQFDAQGRQVGEPISDEVRQRVESALNNLANTTKTTDTQQIRLAAEQVAESVRESGITTRATYPAIAAYQAPGGEALIQLMVPVAIKAVVLIAMAAILLLIRHRGPTMWWTAAVTAIALVGMSDRFMLAPSVFGLFGLATTLWILHAHRSGQSWAVWLLIPLELLWVNVDASFALGFVLVGIALVCQILRLDRSGTTNPEPKSTGLAAAFVIALIATVANPFGIAVWSVPYDWTRLVLSRGPYVVASVAAVFGNGSDWVRDAIRSGGELLTLAPDMYPGFSPSFAQLFSFGNFVAPPIAAVLIILASLGSFVLNRRRFQLSRLLIVLFCVSLFVFADRYISIAVIGSAVMLALNGQEWFLDRFGTETRITNLWWAWSQGGRAVTVLGIVAIALASITGWLGSVAGGDFGYGIQWVQYDLKPGQLLRRAALKGKVLNTVPLQGNLLIWQNYPSSQVYLDSREMLHMGHLSEFEALKLALRDNELDVWKEALDRYGISHIILNMTRIADRVAFPLTYSKMNREANSKWRLIQLSANSAVFGRTDLDESGPIGSDLDWFNQHAFDPARMVYATEGEPLPEPPGPVSLPSWIDTLWRRRRVLTPQAIAASHYLSPATFKAPSEDESPQATVFVVPPENCFLAIRDVRRGLAQESRVSPWSYAMLSKAYYYLYNTELFVAPTRDVHEMRLLQVVTALNQLVSANPDDVIARLQLALRCRMLNYLDLADQHMDALLKLWPENEKIEDFLFDGGQRLTLDKTILIRESENIKNDLERVQYEMAQLGAQLANPVAKANFWMARGCPAKAIEQLNEAYNMGMSVNVAPLLARLYLRVGQPGDTERGADHEMINMQGSGGMKPGEKEELWSLIKLMQGDYERARTYLEAAIADTRINMAKESIMALTNQLRTGSVIGMAFSPVDLIDDVERLIRMEYHLGLMHLEAGEPNEAAKHFKQALAIRPDSPFRPVIGFYLAKITGEVLETLPESPTDDEPAVPGIGPGRTQPIHPAELPAKPDSESK